MTVAGFSENGDRDYFNKSFPELKGKMNFVYREPKKFHRLRQAYSYLSNHSHWYRWAESKELEQKLQGLLDANDFDIFQVEFSSMGHFDLQTDAIRILDAHNVEYDNFRRMSTLDWSMLRKSFYRHEYEKCYEEEIAAIKRQNALFVTSKRDGELFAKDAPGVKQFVIPNGVDTSYFKPKKAEQEPFSIVFTGAMKYVPNYDGMIWFIEEIFPIIKKIIPQAKVYVVGSGPPPILKAYESDSVIITGFVDDVRPYVDEAGVFVVPLNMGSGTRLKVLEALSMKKPVVSTSIGCEGIEVEDDEHILIRDNPGEFAEAVIEVFNNQKLKKRLIDNGYQLVKEKYDWTVIGESIEESFEVLTTKELVPQ